MVKELDDISQAVLRRNCQIFVSGKSFLKKKLTLKIFWLRFKVPCTSILVSTVQGHPSKHHLKIIRIDLLLEIAPSKFRK